ncbi:MAG: hypothetical protein JWP61_1546 [Friedmanniella sp.]|nr:hypothetical protein [Friedmanniella sp.]
MSGRTRVRRLAAGAKGVLRRHSGPVGSVVAVRTGQTHVVLTYDDGPEPGGTDAILGSLDRHGATATFFVLLSRVRRQPGLLAEVVAAGHEVALHGVDHQPLVDFGYRAARARTAAARDELEGLVGAPVRWFRPPYGRQNPLTWRAVTSLGLTPVLWGATSWDWRDLPQADRVAKAQAGVAPGTILLAHDAFAGALDGVAQRPEPVLDRGDLTDQILTAYAARGWQGRSLGDALADGTAVREARFRG